METSVRCRITVRLEVGKRNVATNMNKAAQALGRLAKGKPKNYSAEEIARRSKILAGINARKRAKAKKRRIPNGKVSDERL